MYANMPQNEVHYFTYTSPLPVIKFSLQVRIPVLIFVLCAPILDTAGGTFLPLTFIQ